MKTPIPPAIERKAILASIEERTTSINASISRLEREIELLQEYRTRLVSDVVTGKLDVRDAAGRIPEEAKSEEIAEDELAGADEDEETEE